jgi:hypothetical protein
MPDETVEKNLQLLKHDPAAMQEYQAASDGFMHQWWRALRLSDDYAAALRGELGEPWASMAADFGELHKSFAAWWAHRGMNLFARAANSPSVRKLEVGELIVDHADRPTLYVAIPLLLSKQAMSRQINQLVEETRMKLGLDDAVESWEPRRGFYKDTRLHLPTIKKMLDVWEAKRDTGLDWWQIGEQLAVSESAASSPDDDPQTTKEKRRIMTISTQRLHRMATALIDYAAKGDFPRVK